ncbi:hypothetical protein ACJ72_03769 [Emergomyces africanus]|uniref:Uncharacterized protein n=1 Tax=Emergomyces africanus TaxID=1955775 RepID=A0A1B7NYM3_9EURO|nr:hypothetical protein ACJ72_03769 [Emergomyces africanus]
MAEASRQALRIVNRSELENAVERSELGRIDSAEWLWDLTWLDGTKPSQVWRRLQRADFGLPRVAKKASSSAYL